MKLGVVSDCIHYKTPQGDIGTENHILLRQFEALSAYFTQTLICCPFEPYDATKVISVYTRKNIQFEPVPSVGGDTIGAKLAILKTMSSWWQAYKKVDSFSDIVYQRFPNNLNIPAFFYFYARRKKVFATYTGTWNAYPSEPWTYRLQRGLLEKFFRGPVWVYADRVVNNKKIHSGFSPSYSLSEWEEETLQVQQRIQRIEATGLDELKLITVGKLIGYKNQAAIISACHLLKREGILFSLSIVGDGPIRNELEKLILEKDLVREVKLLGKKTHTELRQLYRQHDFVVQAPLSEGFGKVPVEGFFHGLIPVISDVGMARYFTAEGKRGFLFDPTNDKDLAATLKNISKSQANLPDMIRSGRAFSKDHTLENWANEYYQTVTDYFGKH